jgi:hypothetical protein
MTGSDYNPYEGAEDLPDGTRPLISTRESTEPYVTYLITGEITEITRENPTGGVYHVNAHILRPGPLGEEDAEEEWWYRETPREDVAKRLGTLLPRDADRLTLEVLGFSRSI